MEEERIKVVKTWPELQSVEDIQVFLGFANFYRKFIRNFSKIATSLTSMLWTTNKAADNEVQSTQDENQDLPGTESASRVGGAGGDYENLSNTGKLRKRSKANSPKADFLTFGAKKAFIHLRKDFTKALIFRYYDLEPYIWIETNALGYTIAGVLSQMTLDQHFSGHVTHKDPISSKSEIGQWYPVAFFSQKMIPTKARYKIYGQKLLAIVEAFKTWYYYLKGCKYEVLVLIDHNNFRRFMNTKSLSSCQVCWGQKLFWYHFRIDYCQGKANAAADALSRFP